MIGPKISVCITAFNQENYIKQAIESVLNQTLLPFELLIIDDHSDDQTASIILDYSLHNRLIRTIFNSVNQGVARTRNIGLTEAVGDYLTFLDGDDYFLPQKLEEEITSIIKGNYDFAYSNFHNINREGKLISPWISDESYPVYNNLFVRTFSLEFPQRILFRSELVNLNKWIETGLFDESLEIWEDFEMRIRLSKQLKGIYNPKICHAYRRHDEGLSTTKIALSATSLEYILKKNDSLLKDISQKDRKKIKRSLRNIISDGYCLMAKNTLLKGSLSFKEFLVLIKYLTLSQKRGLYIKSIFSFILFVFKSRNT
jgi:glycosyltransferase involved in cell wall biosynthesis